MAFTSAHFHNISVLIQSIDTAVKNGNYQFAIEYARRLKITSQSKTIQETATKVLNQLNGICHFQNSRSDVVYAFTTNVIELLNTCIKEIKQNQKTENITLSETIAETKVEFDNTTVVSMANLFDLGDSEKFTEPVIAEYDKESQVNTVFDISDAEKFTWPIITEHESIQESFAFDQSEKELIEEAVIQTEVLKEAQDLFNRGYFENAYRKAQQYRDCTTTFPGRDQATELAERAAKCLHCKTQIWQLKDRKKIEQLFKELEITWDNAKEISSLRRRREYKFKKDEIDQDDRGKLLCVRGAIRDGKYAHAKAFASNLEKETKSKQIRRFARVIIGTTLDEANSHDFINQMETSYYTNNLSSSVQDLIHKDYQEGRLTSAIDRGLKCSLAEKLKDKSIVVAIESRALFDLGRVRSLKSAFEKKDFKSARELVNPLKDDTRSAAIKKLAEDVIFNLHIIGSAQNQNFLSVIDHTIAATIKLLNKYN